MRVAHITTVHHPEDPRIFWKECRTLAHVGFDVTLLAQRDSDAAREGVKICALTPTDGRYCRLPLLIESYRKAKKLDAELYHIHDPELIPVAWLLKRATGARVVYDMHEDYWWKGAVEGRIIRLLEKWCFSWADHVVVANKHELHIPEENQVPHSVVANYPLRKERLPEPRPMSRMPMRLVYTGVISEIRGLFFLMDVAAAIKEKKLPCELDIRGICNFAAQREKALRRYASDDLHAVMSEPQWDSYVPPKTLACHVDRADIGLVLLSPVDAHKQVLPTKLFEYLQAALPVVMSDAAVWRAFVEEHDCGAVVEYGDTDQMCRILQGWLDDPQEYERLSRNALEASKNFQWEDEGRRLVTIYHELLR